MGECRASWLQAVNDRFQLIGITRAGKIVKARNPPGEAIRGPSRSSTALDPEPTAQTAPKAHILPGWRFPVAPLLNRSA
jgi:hypothetical protein